jgi:CDP-paratose 2-epimerase
MTILVTGGAGFIGSNLAVSLARDEPGTRVIALDNLRRRGSEVNLRRLREHEIEFVHGDVRVASDVELGGRPFDVLVECSAETSVLAGYDDAPGPVLDTNLTGAIHCFEAARRRGARVVFLSTSRVYPISSLNAVPVVERATRFELAEGLRGDGVSEAGVTEQFPLEGARSLYGASKLAAELLLHEYGAAYGLEYVVDRLGVVAGPGQMGKVEQGVFTLWMARHYFGDPLAYRGWGGTGKQVRDLLHVEDLSALVRRQLARWADVRGRTYNVGGGRQVSLSLVEATALCTEITGRTLDIGQVADTHPYDVRLYLSDHSLVTRDTGWRPERDPRRILEDIYRWLQTHEADLAPVLRGM